ncbi:PD-(D/E)XK nuclease family protein [Hydrogenovibrio kuenenii]|uniref:PD-(D/E)XK nuclease family protein n=1 Tax=Hydrogenovibrio kuenenii TaxID=63658 RepID=UPI0004646567|nr:PD-(D/E)XK nuclease family protein [Hydrogenovibrio kuenenii]
MNLSPNCLHITVNSRLTQFLKSSFIAQQAERRAGDQSIKVALTPQVMTWIQWWQTWQDALLLRGEVSLEALPKKVISDFEAQNLWHSLLEDACVEEGLLLLNKAQTAKQLHQAWLYDHEYLYGQLGQEDVPDALFSDLYLTEETQLYIHLKQRYLAVLQQRQLWDSALLMQYRLDWFDSIEQAPMDIKLQGFDIEHLDDLPPYMKHWIQLVRAKGGQVEMAETEPSMTAPQQLYRAMDEVDEAQQAAAWAYEQYQNLSREIQAPRIAIVAPDISTVEPALTWALDEQLLLQEAEPLKLFQPQATPSKFYNVSLGRSLADVPLVKNALQVLEFAISASCKAGDAAKFEYNQVSEWLISPYTPGDFVERQALDFRLRTWQWAKLSLNELLKALQPPDAVNEADADAGPAKSFVYPPKGLLKALKAMAQSGRFLNRQAGKALSAQAFYEFAIEVLEASDWATTSADGALNSVEFQQKLAFLKALYLFSDQLVLTSKHGSNQLAATEWLVRLRQFVAEQLHQPESVSDAPIQVIGMLEAGGQHFDALWVMGMTANAWPREAKPNPFLPIALQREYQLPRADVARELRYAQRLTERLATSAQQVVWSYAQQSEGQLNLISPLVESYLQKQPEESMEYAPLPYQSLAEVMFLERTPVEMVLDNKAPAVTPGDKVPGGSAILTAQQKCPLMAFFDYRLGAKYQLETVEQGMQSNHLGTLVHQVLEWFWQEVKNQSALIRLSDEQLKQKLDDLLQQAMQTMDQHFNEHYLALEKKRIGHLLFEWLQLEKQRPAFEVVAFEQAVELDLAGIKLSIKIDRIDQLETDGIGQPPVFILDYKTGKATINDLLKVPLEAPQLAIYLHAFDEGLPMEQAEVKGLGYGMIHSDDGVKFSVVAENEAFLPNKKATNFEALADKVGEFEGASWEAFLQHLKASVLALATSVQQGNADMLFAKPTDVQYAASLLALRLPEAQALLADG